MARSPRARPFLIAAAVVAAACLLAAFPSVPAALVTVFLLGVPALAVALPWRTAAALPRVVVAVTVSLAVNGLVAETMLAAGVWSPTAGIVVVGAAAAGIGLALDLTVPHPRHLHLPDLHLSDLHEERAR